MRNYKRGDVVKRQRERKSNVFMRLYLFDYPSVTYGDSSPDKGSQSGLFRHAPASSSEEAFLSANLILRFKIRRLTTV